MLTIYFYFQVHNVHNTYKCHIKVTGLNISTYKMYVLYIVLEKTTEHNLMFLYPHSLLPSALCKNLHDPNSLGELLFKASKTSKSMDIE